MKSADKRVLVLLSGGIDSSTCLAMAVKEHGKENVFALILFYGQKHSQELNCAKNVAEYYGVKTRNIDLSSVFAGSDCPLIQGSHTEIPKKSYSEQLKSSNGHPVVTYVPFRNGLFLSVAAACALSENCSEIIYGAHADDSAGNAYPDTSPAFNAAMNKAIFTGSGEALTLTAPFENSSKKDIVKIGLTLGVPYELTWSCYEGEKEPCGKCGTCLDRAAAFEANNAVDPAIKSEN
ncbi:MAG: 7-cyano-7-deazaguanine synthase QueC [Ruminococcus sp.]|jgi:7-cyano-7-deazaguanine synthase|nr:7-cyano-7-deazaguanine synthase QueC [Ruminococcus sp.]